MKTWRRVVFAVLVKFLVRLAGLSRNARTFVFRADKMASLDRCIRRMHDSAHVTQREISMKRLLAVLIAAAFSATAAAQSAPASADDAAAKAEAKKAKQEMVKGTTEAATKQSSGAGYQGTQAPTQRTKKLTKEEKKKAMEGVSKSAASQYGPSAAAQAAKIDPNAPKVAKPDMSDPKVREAMQKQKGG